MPSFADFSLSFTLDPSGLTLPELVEQRQWALATAAWSLASAEHKNQAFLRAAQWVGQGLFTPLEPARAFCALALQDSLPPLTRRRALGALLAHSSDENAPLVRDLLAQGPLSRLMTKNQQGEAQSPLAVCALGGRWATLSVLLHSPHAERTLSADSFLDIAAGFANRAPAALLERLLSFKPQPHHRSPFDNSRWTQVYGTAIDRELFSLAHSIGERMRLQDHPLWSQPHALGFFLSRRFSPTGLSEQVNHSDSGLSGLSEPQVIAKAQERLSFLQTEFGSFRQGGAALLRAVSAWGMTPATSPTQQCVSVQALRPLLDFVFEHGGGEEDCGSAALGHALRHEQVEMRDYFVEQGALNAPRSSALSICALNGSLTSIRWLMNQGVSLREDPLALASIFHGVARHRASEDAALSFRDVVDPFFKALSQGTDSATLQASAQLALAQVAVFPERLSRLPLEALRAMGANPALASTPEIEAWRAQPQPAGSFAFDTSNPEPLVCASEHGHAVLTQWLLERGAPAKGFAGDGAPLKAVARRPLLRRDAPTSHRPHPSFAQCVTLLGQHGAFTTRLARRIAQMDLDPVMENAHNSLTGLSNALWVMQEYAQSWLQRQLLVEAVSTPGKAALLTGADTGAGAGAASAAQGDAEGLQNTSADHHSTHQSSVLPASSPPGATRTKPRRRL